MGAHNCTIGHHRCHLWVLGELFEHVGPNSVLFPACVALENAVPLAIPVWQFTPLGARAQNPVNCLNETATHLPCVGTSVSLQKRVKFLPLTVGNLSCRHPAIVAIVSESIKCQRNLVNWQVTQDFRRDWTSLNISLRNTKVRAIIGMHRTSGEHMEIKGATVTIGPNRG